MSIKCTFAACSILLSINNTRILYFHYYTMSKRSQGRDVTGPGSRRDLGSNAINTIAIILNIMHSLSFCIIKGIPILPIFNKSESIVWFILNIINIRVHIPIVLQYLGDPGVATWTAPGSRRDLGSSAINTMAIILNILESFKICTFKESQYF